MTRPVFQARVIGGVLVRERANAIIVESELRERVRRREKKKKITNNFPSY